MRRARPDQEDADQPPKGARWRQDGWRSQCAHNCLHEPPPFGLLSPTFTHFQSLSLPCLLPCLLLCLHRLLSSSLSSSSSLLPFRLSRQTRQTLPLCPYSTTTDACNQTVERRTNQIALFSFLSAPPHHHLTNPPSPTTNKPKTTHHGSNTLGSHHREAFLVRPQCTPCLRCLCDAGMATMEDAHTTLLELEDAKGTAFYAVYDGHGGPNVAKYCGEGLHKRIVADKAFGRGEYSTAIKHGFLEMDRALRHDPEYGEDTSGCTAITATITDKNVLFVGNAGDSRAVLGSDGTALIMSSDHKPVNREESRRIVAAGGFVESGRVNGSLALSRALGDFEFKTNATLGPEDQIVTANPIVAQRPLTDDDEFLVLACDGIWDCMSSQEVVTFVRKGIADRIPLDTLCEMTMDHCLAADSEATYIGCDNMTMLIVAFLNGRTVEEWYDHVGARVSVRLGPADPSIARPNGDEDPEILAEEAALANQRAQRKEAAAA